MPTVLGRNRRTTRHTSFVHDDRAVSEWTFTGTGADGSRVEAQGVDLFTLRDGKIITKHGHRSVELALRFFF